jgi:hypothetical protein
MLDRKIPGLTTFLEEEQEPTTSYRPKFNQNINSAGNATQGFHNR